jgi:hypothetical protein
MGHDPAKYDFDAVFAAANLATSMQATDLPAIVALLRSEDGGVRYWGATGLLAQGEAGVAAGRAELLRALADESPSVQIVAAEAIARFGAKDEVAAALERLLHWADPDREAYVSLAAWNAIDSLDERARPIAKRAAKLRPSPSRKPQRYGDYAERVKRKTLADVE